MFDPYPYQERVIEALMSGRNIILVVPTGSGKTYASLLPFLQSRLFNTQLLPNKALYAVPMRVLATQFQTTCQDLLKDLDPLYVDELKTRYENCGHQLLSIQTGESPLDPQFESMITACTIDQLLASALGVPYSVSARSANINVGALCSSYLILDEPHLYPITQNGRSYKGAFTTCLEMLRLLKGLTRFIFMSATMSRPLVKKLAKMLDAEVITATEDELIDLNKQRTRTYERATTYLDATAVLAQHEAMAALDQYNHCSLAVCNTVQRAQKLYLTLDELITARHLDIELKLLHSRFTDHDRKEQGKELQELLGKEQWHEGIYQGQKDVIVVATQVVEVGLDISAQIVHTELAPANSIVQRAGRCARFAKQQGRVIIYQIEPKKPNKPVSYLPYNAELCEQTWEALARYDGSIVGFTQEQELVDTIHTAGDLDLLQRYEEHRSELQDVITKSLQNHQRQDTPTAELIRDVTQTQIIIHNTPNETITTIPWRWQSFGLHPGLLMGTHWEDLKRRQNETNADGLKKAVLAPTEQPDDEEDNHAVNTYTWDPIRGEGDVPTALMIAIPNELATYHSELGLVFLDGRLPLSPRWQQKVADTAYQSEKLKASGRRDSSEGTVNHKSYEKHIEGLTLAYYAVLYEELQYGMTQLEGLLKLDKGSIDQAIQLAIATHDLGKLDQRWQNWARAWQRLRHSKKWTTPYIEPPDSVFLAKTDYYHGPAYTEQAKEQQLWKQELKDFVRPHHACESVAIGRKLIANSLGMEKGVKGDPRLPLLRATCAAIAHHHTTSTHEYGTTQLAPEAAAAVDAALRNVRREGKWSYDIQQLQLNIDKGDLFRETAIKGQFTKSDFSDEQHRYETWLAYLITRALRLADQRADVYNP